MLFDVVLQTYFVDLTAHHRMLASLRDLADSSTRQHHEQQHAELDEVTSTLQENAEFEQRRLRSIIRQWQEFVTFCAIEHDWLSELAMRRQRAAVAADTDTATLKQLRKLSDEYHDIRQSVAARTSATLRVCTCIRASVCYIVLEELLTAVKKGRPWLGLVKALGVHSPNLGLSPALICVSHVWRLAKIAVVYQKVSLCVWAGMSKSSQ